MIDLRKLKYIKFQRSSVSRVILSGKLNRYTIHSSVTTNKVFVSAALYDEQKATVYSYVNATLINMRESSERAQGPSNPINVGDLVYTYNRPSSSHNKPQTKDNRDSLYNKYEESQEEMHKRDRQNVREYESSQEQSEEQYMKTHSKKSRSRRSIMKTPRFDEEQRKNRRQSESDTSSSSSSSSDSSEEVYQPKPTMDKAPETPFLPLSVGFEGKSVQHAVDTVSKCQKMIMEIGQATVTPSKLPSQNSLEKFLIVIDLMSGMNENQIGEVCSKLFSRADEKDEANLAAWKICRDAVAQTGTGPALKQIAKWIQSKKVRGEEAAQLLAALPQNVRVPTDEYLMELFVSSSKYVILFLAGLLKKYYIKFLAFGQKS